MELKYRGLKVMLQLYKTCIGITAFSREQVAQETWTGAEKAILPERF